MKEHIQAECRREDCNGSCPECCLSVCSVCGLSEGAQTTHCPGEPSGHRADEVYAGKRDYRDGEWIEACSTHSPMAQVNRQQNFQLAQKIWDWIDEEVLSIPNDTYLQMKDAEVVKGIQRLISESHKLSQNSDTRKQ